jgi:hypothetical protein
MRSSSKEVIEHPKCPKEVSDALERAGGLNRFSEPNFRVVWGYDRIVPISGEWQEFEQYVATLRDKLTGYTESRPITRLVRSVVETRMVPKYLPGNCWHLEMWRPPEEYGSPEAWGKLGEEVIGCQTVDTAGPYPSRGEYELCYPLTSDGTSHGTPIPLVAAVVEEIVRMIVVGRERFNLQHRKAAIEQEQRRKEDGFVRLTEDQLKDGLRPFAGESFIVKP